MFDPSQGWGAVLGSVYQPISPLEGPARSNVLNMCVCMVEMEHDVFWGPEEKILLVCEWPGKGRGPALGM